MYTVACELADFAMRNVSRYLGHDAMRNVSRYLGHDAIRIAILVYRINQCLELQFVYNIWQLKVNVD